MSEQLNKILNVTRSDMPPFEDYAGLIEQLWESRHISNDGVLHNRLEEKLGNYFGADNVFLFCNGHLALSCAIRALNLSGVVKDGKSAANFGDISITPLRCFNP